MTEQTRRGVVLVACEDDDARRICKACLEHAGYLVQVAEDPNAALAIARSTLPDLVVTSFPTYTSSGLAVTTLLRRDDRLAHTPVLSLATWTRKEDLADASAAGVSESLEMPVPLHTLVETVGHLVRADSRAQVRRATSAPPTTPGKSVPPTGGERRQRVDGRRGH